MEVIANRLIGDAANFSFQHRMLNFILSLAVFMTFLGGLVDLLLMRSWVFWLFSDLIWIILLYQSRIKKNFTMTAIISFSLLVFIFFPYSWLFNFGSQGSFPYYAILFTAIIATVLTGVSRYIMVSSMIGVVLTLITLEYYFPGFIKVNRDETTRYVDIYIHLTICMLIIAFLIIVYSNVYKKEKERSDSYARSVKEHYHQQLYYMENLEQLIFRLKAERHDFNHHLGVISGLLAEDEIAAVSTYTGKLIAETEEYHNIINIPYSIIRAMLNYKLSTVREDTELKLNIKVPEGLKLNEFDLTIILGNLLDNALEACLKIEPEDRYLSLSITYNPDYLVIDLENPTGEDTIFQDGKIRTTKKDTTNHGIGLNNIRYLVNKHNGFMNIEEGDGGFRVQIALLVD